MAMRPLLLCALLFTTVPAAGAGGDGRRVAVQPYGEIAIHPRRSAPATVVSINDSRLAGQIRARIETIEVAVGDSVDKGDLLIRLDCRDHRLALAAAEASLALASEQATRAHELVGRNAVSRELLDLRTMELEGARAERDRAALDVTRCDLRAPFTGIVVERLAGEGETAEPGLPLLRLIDTARIELAAEIPTDGVATFKGAERLLFESRAGSHEVRLRTLLPVVRTESRVREARLIFVDEPPLPGSSGRLVWTTTTPHLPASLLVRRDGGLGVFVTDGARARFLPLAEALEGHPAPAPLAPGTAVVTDGRHGLRDGDPVRIAE